VGTLTKDKIQEATVPGDDALFRALIAAAVDGILVTDAHGTVRVYSGACERLFGYEAHDVIGQNVKMLMPRVHGDWDVGYRLVMGQRRDGSTFPMELAVGEARGGGKRLFTSFVRDITERQGGEQRLHELQAELLHVSRMNAMVQMSSAITHELNEPLTAIINYVEAASRMLDSSGQAALTRAQEIIGKASKQILRANSIIRNLRDFTEKCECRRTSESLNRAIEEAVALGFAGAAQVNVKIQLNLDPALPPVLIDKIQIQQVLTNLIRNSIEAMHAAERRELSVTTGLDGPGFVQVIVRDTGHGLSDEIKNRLFQPFVTTKDNGMGIGLTICQTIIDAHGGSICAVHDDNPDGAAFCFRLPLASYSEDSA